MAGPPPGPTPNRDRHHAKKIVFLHFRIVLPSQWPRSPTTKSTALDSPHPGPHPKPSQNRDPNEGLIWSQAAGLLDPIQNESARMFFS